MPDGQSFIVISGLQPATATLFDSNCNPVFEFGKRYRNTIRFDKFSNALLLGGFGNLAGEIDFWSLDT
jgi:translation initiation factor 2A